MLQTFASKSTETWFRTLRSTTLLTREGSFVCEKWAELQKPQNQQAPIPPQSRARARGAALFASGGRPNNPFLISFKWLWRRQSVFSLLCLLCLWGALGGSNGFLYQFARFAGAALEFGETTSIAAGQALNLTGTVAATASTILSSAAVNGLSAADNAWRGVDIYDLESHRCAGQLTVEGEEVLTAWVADNTSHILIPCLTETLVSHLKAAVQSVSVSMPGFQTAHEELFLTHSFNHTKVHAFILPSGLIQLGFDHISMDYSLQWANPFWAQLGLDVAMERDQVLASLRRALVLVPTPSPTAWQPPLALEVQMTWPVLRARCRSFLRHLCLVLLQLVQGALEVSWQRGGMVFLCGGVSASILCWVGLIFWRYVTRLICRPHTPQTTHMGPLALLDGPLVPQPVTCDIPDPDLAAIPRSPSICASLAASLSSSYAMVSSTSSDESSVEIVEPKGGHSVEGGNILF